MTKHETSPRSARSVQSVLSVLFVLSLAATAPPSLAATATWNSAWSGGSGAGGAPSSADDVVIRGGDLAWTASLPAAVASWVQESGYADTVTFQTVYGAAGFTNFHITGNCVVSNGTWTHVDNSSTEAYRLKISIGGSFTLESGATIDASVLGYDGN